MEIKERLDDLNKYWEELLRNTAEKGERLQQAREQQEFYRSLDGLKIWMNDVETLLASEDLGQNLPTVKFLLKKQLLVESDIEVHKNQIQTFVTQAASLVHENHFASKSIQKEARDLCQRYDELVNLGNGRRIKLEHSLVFNQFCYDLDVEMSWIKEHVGLASSDDVGTSLADVKRLMKRHEALENELTNHQSMIDCALATGQNLIVSNHYASSDVEERCENLKMSWNQLMELSTERKIRLGKTLESQKYFTEANEAYTWINDKARTAASQDNGKDEAATEKLLTKHRALDTDIENFSTVISSLRSEAKRLATSKHSVAIEIGARQKDIEEQFAGLQTKINIRLHRLEETKQLHQYTREVTELADWIREQLQIASSEDYGKDFEHLEIIQRKFNDFKRIVTGYSERYNDTDNFAEQLVAKGHTDAVLVKEHQSVLRTAWTHLQEQISVRNKRLTSAAEIHRFNRDLNELVSRIQEKDATLSMDNLGRDLAGVQALQRRHEGYEHDLNALEQQIEVLTSKSRSLQAAYHGHTAQTIQQHEDYVCGMWEELKRKTARKKIKLKDSYEFQKLNSRIRDLLSWCIDMSRTIVSEETVHGVDDDAESLLQRLEEYKSEMDTREEAFNQVMDTGEKMIENGHFATDEITEKLELLLTERESLYATWEDSKMEIDQVHNLQVFLRDAKHIERLTSTQEAILVGAELGNSVDEVDTLLRKHENTEKLVNLYEDKISNLCLFGEHLVQNRHSDSEQITDRLKSVCARRNKLKEDLSERRSKLEDSRRVAQFYQDVVEVRLGVKQF